MKIRYSKNQSAFTIVELLIVIVVVAILAAISIVAYNGIQSRARASSASSAAAQAAKKLALYQVDNGVYPATGALMSAGIVNGNGTNYQYTSSASTFCLTASVGGTSYNVSQAQTPQAGACSGQVNGGAITNLSTNPSFESGTTANWGLNSATSSFGVNTASSPQGSRHLRLSRSASGDSYAVWTGQSIVQGAPYTLSFWIWSDSATTLDQALAFRHSVAPYTAISSISNRTVTTTPTRVIMTGISSSTVGGNLQIILRAAAVGVNIYYDGFMVTEGSDTYMYADGNSSGWSWTGAANNSSSVGPEL